MKQPSCFREFARYASLNVLGMIGLSCYILADTYFISVGMGADGLAALNLAIPVYSFINGSGLMVGMGGGTQYSIRQNQGEPKEADRAFSSLGIAGPGVLQWSLLPPGLLLPEHPGPAAGGRRQPCLR